MKVRTYKVLEHAVEVGVHYGWNRAHKHEDSPPPESIRESIIYYVMNELTEWFIVDDDEITEE